MSIPAIQTHYAGCHFRSRLEARWAVFFDTLRVAWEYEKEGFRLTSGPYLPDFWIPDLDSWVEIKPEDPTPLERNLADELAVATGKKVYIFCTRLCLPSDDVDRETPSAEVLYPSRDHWDLNHQWCECKKCGKLGIEYEGRADRIVCECNVDRWCDDCSYLNADSPRLIEAYTAALSARFEHGESPQTENAKRRKNELIQRTNAMFARAFARLKKSE